jgi:serpin B
VGEPRHDVPPGLRAARRDVFQAETATLDFGDPAALDTINGWVSRKTSEKIPTLLNAGDLNGAPRCWRTRSTSRASGRGPFDKAQTRDGVFRLANGKTKTLPMMAQTGTFPTRKGDGFEAVRLPYGKSGDLAMFVFLPDETSDLGKLLDGLDGTRWEEWMTGFRDGEVEVVLPRFKVAGDATLNEPLAALGMGVAFGAGADFGPMGLPGHFLSVVKHKAVMEVNEEGTEAAAATGVVSTVSLKPRFEVNRPFLCAIRDNRTGALLFLGAIADPQ